VSVFIQLWLNNFYFSSSFIFEIVSISITISVLHWFSFLFQLLENFSFSFYIDAFALIDKMVARKGCYQLRQLRVVSRSFTHQTTLALFHAFVTSRIDCCSSLLVGLPLGTLARLDRVLRSAVRLVGRQPKFSSITAYMRDVLHWLPISQQIHYRITAMVSRCVLRCAPSYLWAGLLIAVAPRYRYCSGATFTVAVAVARNFWLTVAVVVAPLLF